MGSKNRVNPQLSPQEIKNLTLGAEKSKKYLKIVPKILSKTTTQITSNKHIIKNEQNLLKVHVFLCVSFPLSLNRFEQYLSLFLLKIKVDQLRFRVWPKLKRIDNTFNYLLCIHINKRKRASHVSRESL